MKTVNVLTENFKTSLMDLINQCELPLAIIYYIYKDIGYDLEKTYYNVLNAEMSQPEIEQEQSLNIENNNEEIQ